MGSERDDNVYIAKLAEQAERYEEMVDAMKNVASLNTELSIDERNLLSVAYKNVIGARRAAWRIIASIEQKEKTKGNEHRVHQIKAYSSKIDKELNEIVSDVMKVINDHLLPHATTEESKVFYYKMKGDYYRYKAEYTADEIRKEAANHGLEGYQAALELANKHLPSTNPVRLGLALNFSVFYYEILNEQKKAVDLAKKAFDEALGHIDGDEDDYKDSTVIMQLLRDNVTLWTQGDDGED